jgi:hypothetical protein
MDIVQVIALGYNFTTFSQLYKCHSSRAFFTASTFKSKVNISGTRYLPVQRPFLHSGITADMHKTKPHTYILCYVANSDTVLSLVGQYRLTCSPLEKEETK